MTAEEFERYRSEVEHSVHLRVAAVSKALAALEQVQQRDEQVLARVRRRVATVAVSFWILSTLLFIDVGYQLVRVVSLRGRLR